MFGLLLAALQAFSAAAAQAQTAAIPVIEIPTPGVTQELELNDGSSVIGRVQSIDGERFVFRSTAGVEMRVERSGVRSLKPVTGRIVNGQLWREDPNTTRLFFGPTGRSLKKGEVYFGVYEVLLPFVQVGITDRLSIGGGTPLFFGEDIDRVFWLTPKFQVTQRGTFTAALGVMHFFNIDEASIGIAYGAVTQGNSSNALTVGVGYSYARSDEHDAGAAVLMIGGERQVSKRIKLVTENYAFKGGGILSGGVRFFGEKLAADFGLFTPLAADGFYLLPMINIVRKF